MRNNAHNTDDEVLIRAEHVSKKFCRSLKRSLWYGAQDVANSLMPWKRSLERIGIGEKLGEPELRPEEFWAVRDVSFEVRRGECLGLIGHNGAGKSTLLKILNSLIRPDSGRITMKGRVGALIELSAGFNPILTGRENIYNQAALLGFSKKETDANFDAIVDFAQLEPFLDMPVQNYSSGMRVKLGFAVSTQLEPDILLIDEVLAVGDIGFRQKSLNKMAELLDKCAVIFVTHSMPQILRVCNEVMVLENGKSLFKGADIGAGVERFIAHFDSVGQTVTGSGEVEVVGLTIWTVDGCAGLGETVNVRYGDEVTISIEVRAREHLRAAKLHFVVWNSELLPVLDVMGPDLTGFQFEFGHDGRSKLTARIGELFLGAGKYSVSAVINSIDNKRVLCRFDSAVNLLVRADSFSGAHALHCPEWSIESVSKEGQLTIEENA
ncbi:ABC transporter ATP-binding protein [Elongatibacter sediminis]|uniref:ABC transporter ATP-binding protein n=1 Tax=Elongatibacter sediminis TaxID=3119006 RepID=A0AAW9RC24_9GAMM